MKSMTTGILIMLFGIAIFAFGYSILPSPKDQPKLTKDDFKEYDPFNDPEWFVIMKPILTSDNREGAIRFEYIQDKKNMKHVFYWLYDDKRYWKLEFTAPPIKSKNLEFARHAIANIIGDLSAEVYYCVVRDNSKIFSDSILQFQRKEYFGKQREVPRWYWNQRYGVNYTDRPEVMAEFERYEQSVN